MRCLTSLYSTLLPASDTHNWVSNPPCSVHTALIGLQDLHQTSDGSFFRMEIFLIWHNKFYSWYGLHSVMYTTTFLGSISNDQFHWSLMDIWDDTDIFSHSYLKDILTFHLRLLNYWSCLMETNYAYFKVEASDCMKTWGRVPDQAARFIWTLRLKKLKIKPTEDSDSFRQQTFRYDKKRFFYILNSNSAKNIIKFKNFTKSSVVGILSMWDCYLRLNWTNTE